MGNCLGCLKAASTDNDSLLRDNQTNRESSSNRRGTPRAYQIKKIKVEPVLAPEWPVLPSPPVLASTGSKNAVNKIKPYISTQENNFWRNEDAVSEFSQVPLHIAKSVMTLFDQDCTVPFIVRYRKKQSGYLPTEKIREIQITYDNVKRVRKRVDDILKTVGSSNVDKKVITAIKSAKTLDEVEYLYAPLKPENKGTRAERAKNLGLEPLAHDLLDGKKDLRHLFDDIDPMIVKGKNSLAELQKGVRNIISDIIAKDMEILDFIRKHPLRKFIQFFSQESTAVKEAFIEEKHTKNFKFENYFDFCSTVGSISAHQVMAINRGEALKILTVKLVMPPRLKSQIMEECHSCFDALRCKDGLTRGFIDACVKDAYCLLELRTFRQIRSDLTKKAAHESVEIFCANLKRLLLSPPVRGKSVLGVDPGFTHGCKLAALSYRGDVLETGVVYPHSKFQKRHKKGDDYVLIKKMVLTHKITLIAIGNGTACRETETWISELIRNKAFYPHNVKYCIVDESGVSIYSVSKESELEHPGLDPNLRSAVAIARRLQDPLLEYVKVEPKHLGIGMYQHDIPDSMLKTALTSVVVECASFVGVDLNVCPEVLLQKISGLSSAQAKSIIEWRKKNGGFINVHQLLEVKGLEPKSFEQCVGFVKILPQTTPNRNLKMRYTKQTAMPNPLDMTIIHPESYQLAERFLAAMDTDVHEIGKQSLTKKVKNLLTHTTIQHMAIKLSSTDEQIQIIVDAFLNYNFDIRDELDLPLFKTGVASLADLTVNQQLTGRVMNVTNFGAFVDIGVGKDGLIHISQMKDTKLQLGDRVNVRVLSIDMAKERISLQLM